jgi:xenotropic and polytropic retrovirus receptor 1
MKQMLYHAIEASPSAELADPDILTRYLAKFDEQFFHYCDGELTKINTFYSEKLAEATRKYASLRSELSEAQNEGITTEKFSRSKKVLLQNYQNLNFTGFRKILKKHDKLLSVDCGAKWRQEHVELAHFFTNKDIDRLIHETENVVTQEIEAGDRQKAMKRLRVPPLAELQSPWTTFKVGLFSGSFFVLLVAVVISALFKESTSGTYKAALRLYRAPFLIIEFIFLWGINVYGWRSCGVNHVLIFELDPRNHLSEQHIIELGAVFGVLWCISVLW